MGGMGAPLMGIPSLQQWLADTQLRTPRSSEMKAIDKAIETYNKGRTPENIGRIRIALSKWIKSKGASWESSERNRPPRRPISALVDVTVALRARLPPDELASLKWMVDQQKTLLYRNFKDAKLALPGFNAAVDVGIAKDKIKAATSAARSAPGAMAKAAAASEIMQGVNQLFGSQIHDAAALATWVMAETGTQALQTVAQNVADMLPIISLVSGGVKVISQWGVAIYDAYKEVNVYTHRKAVAEGAPQVALEGLQTLLRRETASAAVKASITSAGFAANVALHAAKGAGAVFSPVVGAAQATAQAARVIAYFAMQVREAIIMHKALKKPDELGFETLHRAPLLGCYLLIGASDSELIAMTWDEFGQAGWMDEVTKLLKDMKPLMNSAADVIQSAPFKLTGVPVRRSTNLSNFGKAKSLASWLA